MMIMKTIVMIVMMRRMTMTMKVYNYLSLGRLQTLNLSSLASSYKVDSLKLLYPNVMGG